MNTVLPTASEIFSSLLTSPEESIVGAEKVGMIRAMADFAKAAYNLQHTGFYENYILNDVKPYATEAYNDTVAQQWRPLTFPLLKPVISQGIITSGMTNDGFYINGNAAALVERCGDAVVLSFIGLTQQIQAPA